MEATATTVDSYQPQTIDTKNPTNTLQNSQITTVYNKQQKSLLKYNGRNTYDEVYQEAKVNKLEIESNNSKKSL